MVIDPLCVCPHGERPLGRLYEVNMGVGVVRLSTVPECPIHGHCGACRKSAEACYTKRWANGFSKMLSPCCEDCTHLKRGKR